MTQRLIIAVLAMSLPTVAASQEADRYQCAYGDMQRRVEIAHEPGIEVPCSVHYYKDTEAPGEQQVLWSAQNDASYCRNRAMELVTKLEGWGWDCSRENEDAAMEVAGEAPVSDASEEILGDPDVDETPEREEEQDTGLE